MDDTEDMLAILRSAVAAEPESRTAWYALAAELASLEPQPTEEVLAALDRAESARESGDLSRYGRRVHFFYGNEGGPADRLGLRARVYRRAKRFDDALLTALQWIDIAPDASLPRHVAGVVLLELGRLRDALVRFDEAISLELDPEIAGASWFQRGATHAQLGEYEQAIRDVARALEQAPKRCASWLQYDERLACLNGDPSWPALVARARAYEAKQAVEHAARHRADQHARLGKLDDDYEAAPVALRDGLRAIATAVIEGDAPDLAAAAAELTAVFRAHAIPFSDDVTMDLEAGDCEYCAQDVAAILGLVFAPETGFQTKPA